MRILIAEDERITRMTLARQLTGWGHQVTAAEDGQQAWELFGAADAEFDIVITDWEMPRLSGVELVRHIRQEGRRSAYTYVILLTSRSDKADIVKGIEAVREVFGSGTAIQTGTCSSRSTASGFGPRATTFVRASAATN